MGNRSSYSISRTWHVCFMDGQETGKYSIDRFVWNSIKGAIPLTEIVSTEILIK